MNDQELMERLKLFRAGWIAREEAHQEKMEQLYAELKEEIKLIRQLLNPPDEA